MSGYYFLTGATGLLGNYVLRDLLLAGKNVAVLVRSSRKLSARQRIENLLIHWDQQFGQPLRRPVVLEGDITQPDLGLDGASLRWAAERVSSVIHNAASLSFEAMGTEGEPYRSNINGTRNVLEFARQAGIAEFHHVSTAYVAGLRSGKILECEVDVGQKLGNDYEISKLSAEKMVRSADFINPPTVFRPGIIIGDSQTGFTTTYHGFYAALQLVHTLSQTHVRDESGRICAEKVRLALSGDETKHLVPVDWVSAAMVRVITTPSLHGQTYHLTPRQPVTTRVIRDVLEETIGMYGTQLCGSDHVPANDNDAEALFHEHIRVYNSYWRMDPEFDCSNIEQAAPDLLCPEVNFDMLVRLSRQAIADNFPTPPKKPLPVEFDVDALLQSWRDIATEREGEAVLGLDVAGSGGGQWRLVIADGQVAAVEHGLPDATAPICQTDSSTFAGIVNRGENWRTAFATQKARLTGAGMDSDQAAGLLDQLSSVSVG